MASVPRALTGLVYHYRSLPIARKFVHTFFLSREVDLRNFIKFRDPKLALSFTVAQFGRERPISRWVGISIANHGFCIFPWQYFRTLHLTLNLSDEVKGEYQAPFTSYTSLNSIYP